MSFKSRVDLGAASTDEWTELSLLVRNDDAPPRYTIPQRRSDDAPQTPPEGYRRIFTAGSQDTAFGVTFVPQGATAPPSTPSDEPCSPPLQLMRDDDSDGSAGATAFSVASTSAVKAEVSQLRLDLTNVMIIFAWIAVNIAHVARVLRTMSADDQDALNRVFSLFYPKFPPPYRLRPIHSILKCALHSYGLDYEVRFDDGSISWVRDSDLWRSVNGRLKVSLYWAVSARIFPPAEIDRLLALPQYSAEGGAFLREMKKKSVFGFDRDPVRPRLGYAFV